MNAFDKDQKTSWVTACDKCRPGEAWLGLDFGTHKADIKCMRIIQSGRRERQVSVIWLLAWSDRRGRWEPRERFTGLGGETWNQRPMNADVMWRISFLKSRVEEC